MATSTRKCLQGKQGFQPQMLPKSAANSENKNSIYAKHQYKVKPAQPLQAITDPKPACLDASPKDSGIEIKQQSSSPPTVQRLKFEMCKNWREKGVCKYGDKCLFAHGEKELTKRQTEAPNPCPDSSKPTSESQGDSPVPR